MQRIAIIICLGTAIAASGCTPMGRPGRNVTGRDAMTPAAGNRPVPTALSARENMQPGSRMAVDPRNASVPGGSISQRWPNDNPGVNANSSSSLNSSALSSSGPETARGMAAPSGTNTNKSIPVVAGNQPPGSTASQHGAPGHLCDGSCGAVHRSVVGPDGTVGLPQFRLSDLTEADKLELERTTQMAQAEPMARGDSSRNVSANAKPAVVEPDSQPAQIVQPEKPENGQPVASVTLTPKTKSIPVASPVQTTWLPAPAAQDIATDPENQSDPIQQEIGTDAPARSQPNSLRTGLPADMSGNQVAVGTPAESGSESPTTPSSDSSARPPSDGMVTMIPGHASMQVRVVNDPDTADPVSQEKLSQAVATPPTDSPEPSASTAPSGSGVARVMNLPEMDEEMRAALDERVASVTKVAEPVDSSGTTAPSKSPADRFATKPWPQVAPLKFPAGKVALAEKNQAAAASAAGESSPEAISGSAQAYGIKVDPGLRSPTGNTSRTSPPRTMPDAAEGIPTRFSVPNDVTRLPVADAFPAAGGEVRPASFQQHVPRKSRPSRPAFFTPGDVLSGFPWLQDPIRKSNPENPADTETPAPAVPAQAPSQSDKLPPVNDATTALRLPQQAPDAPQLRARSPAMTSEIMGHGRYLPMDTAGLRGNQTVLLYCELEDYESRAIDGKYATVLDSEIVVTDRTGKTVQQESFPRLNDLAPERRNEFYMYVPLRLNDLAPGEYQVRMKVRDLQSGSTAQTDPVVFGVK